jgi:hypothetical protein
MIQPFVDLCELQLVESDASKHGGVGLALPPLRVKSRKAPLMIRSLLQWLI